MSPRSEKAHHKHTCLHCGRRVKCRVTSCNYDGKVSCSNCFDDTALPNRLRDGSWGFA